MPTQTVVLGISGGSCLELSLHFIKKLPLDIKLLVVPSKNAYTLCRAEKKQNLESQINKIRTHNLEIHNSLTSPLASGSFFFESCIILPTSSNTLSCIAHGIQDNLLTRVGAICLKEKRDLILGVREMPLSAILLENMAKLASIGVCVAPPIVGYYSKIKDLDSMQDFLIGKYFDLLGIPHNLFTRWGNG
ncbi:UbiX family flavin prenyltransferase [Helicobacter sp. MIT 14-3879]|uniref:UbiX family flavin prenyltransferase n=1 Tax=Helicobacter sp. MIT 14-3879 TaxID=2040649 RepID=UPI000E1E6A9A|nr:UbiX family flavin prenyltransferase [Helicobacter sp. MIT 14-3879]RDU60402.1 3-octaprenyl-4-hydroxybenzoate carboxy-lyase [Helicobacter sp. MIT 14-3879]